MTTLTPVQYEPILADITERAMLVDLTINMATFRRFDSDVSREVADKHNAEASMGRYNKLLMDKKYLDPITKAASKLRNEHNLRTLPWSQSGPRILLSVGYLKYKTEIRKLEEEFKARVDEFNASYTQYRDASLSKLGSLATLADYPTPDEVVKLFGVGVNILPFPTGQDFRVNLGAMETERVRQEVTERIHAAIQEAAKEPVARIREVVGHMIERLKLYEERIRSQAKGRQDTFTDSLVTNVKELVYLLPSLNITNDPVLAEITKKMDVALCTLTPNELRISSQSREFVISSAESIMDQLSSIM